MAVKVGEMTNLFSRIPRGFIIEFNSQGRKNLDLYAKIA